MKKVILTSLFLIFGAVFAFSLYQLLSAGQVYREGSVAYEDLAQTAVTKREEEVPPPADPGGTQPEKAEAAKEPLLDVDFEMLRSVNEQVVGWIYSDNEEINYPVVQGEDNEYYLDHLFDGTENKNGTIFMDFRSSPAFEDRNTLIYGHNMGNHTMFAGLVNYSKEGYYEENPVLILVTPEESFYLEVFSGYVTGANSEAYRRDLDNDEVYLDYLRKLCEASEFETSVELTAEDRIVTLSTCSYVYNDARYVLHCKLVPA